MTVVHTKFEIINENFFTYEVGFYYISVTQKEKYLKINPVFLYTGFCQNVSKIGSLKK